MMRKLAIGIAVLALSVYGGASATTSAVSNDALDDQADGTRVGSPAACQPGRIPPHGVGAGRRHSAGSGCSCTRAGAERQSVVGHPARSILRHARPADLFDVAAATARRGRTRRSPKGGRCAQTKGA